MPFDKNIFTKNVHFYTTVVSYTISISPMILGKTCNHSNKLSVYHFSIISEYLFFHLFEIITRRTIYRVNLKMVEPEMF